MSCDCTKRKEDDGDPIFVFNTACKRGKDQPHNGDCKEIQAAMPIL